MIYTLDNDNFCSWGLGGITEPTTAQYRIYKFNKDNMADVSTFNQGSYSQIFAGYITIMPPTGDSLQSPVRILLNDIVQSQLEIPSGLKVNSSNAVSWTNKPIEGVVNRYGVVLDRGGSVLSQYFDIYNTYRYPHLDSRTRLFCDGDLNITYFNDYNEFYLLREGYNPYTRKSELYPRVPGTANAAVGMSFWATESNIAYNQTSGVGGYSIEVGDTANDVFYVNNNPLTISKACATEFLNTAPFYNVDFNGITYNKVIRYNVKMLGMKNGTWAYERFYGHYDDAEEVSAMVSWLREAYTDAEWTDPQTGITWDMADLHLSAPPLTDPTLNAIAKRLMGDYSVTMPNYIDNLPDIHYAKTIEAYYTDELWSMDKQYETTEMKDDFYYAVYFGDDTWRGYIRSGYAGSIQYRNATASTFRAVMGILDTSVFTKFFAETNYTPIAVFTSAQEADRFIEAFKQNIANAGYLSSNQLNQWNHALTRRKTEIYYKPALYMTFSGMVESQSEITSLTNLCNRFEFDTNYILREYNAASERGLSAFPISVDVFGLEGTEGNPVCTDWFTVMNFCMFVDTNWSTLTTNITILERPHIVYEDRTGDDVMICRENAELRFVYRRVKQELDWDGLVDPSTGKAVDANRLYSVLGRYGATLLDCQNCVDYHTPITVINFEDEVTGDGVIESRDTMVQRLGLALGSSYQVSEAIKICDIDINPARYYLYWYDRGMGMQCQPFTGSMEYSESFTYNHVQNLTGHKRIGNMDVSPKWELTSGWLDEKTYPIYESIFTSPYVTLYDTESAKYFSVIVTDKKFVEQDYINTDDMLMLQINLELDKKQTMIY